jgi:hypothetical protein
VFFKWNGRWTRVGGEVHGMGKYEDSRGILLAKVADSIQLDLFTLFMGYKQMLENSKKQQKGDSGFKSMKTKMGQQRQQNKSEAMNGYQKFQ